MMLDRMLTYTATRLLQTRLPATSSLAIASVTTVSPSLCELFSKSLRLSSSTSLLTTNNHKICTFDRPLALPLPNDQKQFVTQSSLNSRNQRRLFSSKSSDVPVSAPIPGGNQQHETWVEFQKSISVSGFETGQTTKVTTRTKRRGGKIDRKRREREEELEAALKGKAFDITTLKGGEFPPLRYSDEETARLLAEAYANIPPRAGKRGTLHMKREKRRWWIKRMYDAKKKRERMAEHERRMAKRHNISKWVYEIKTGAEEVREKDAAYQRGILERWAFMNGYANGEEGLIEQNE